jgi:hypothetical protein
MTCSLTLSSTDVAAGRIAARHRARIAHLRAGSCAVAGAHVDGFASMLLVVLPMRSAEKSKNSSRINRVTLLPMESEFIFAVAESATANLRVQTPRDANSGNALSPALSLFAALLVLTGRGEGINRLRYHQCKCGNSTWQWVCPTVEKGRSNMH